MTKAVTHEKLFEMAFNRTHSLIVCLIFITACGHVTSRSVKVRESSHVPLYFPTSKEKGQHGPFYALACTIGQINGYCILDTGANTSQIANTPETKDFKILHKAKVVSAFGDRVEDVVQVPQVIVGSSFTKKDLPAVRSNAFHDLPEYLAVLGADIFLGTNFIYDVGKDENNPAKLILEPSVDEVSARNFKYFDSILPDDRFIFLKLSIDGVNVKAMWDTHMGRTAFSKKFIRAYPHFFKQISIQNGTDASGKKGSLRNLQLLKPICITAQFCPYTTGEVIEYEIDVTDYGLEPLDVILGNVFIWSFNWYFNFKQQKFSVQPR